MNPVVEQILGKLIIDATFRQMFKADRTTALARYTLTRTERDALMRIDVQALDMAVRNLQMSKSVPTESWFW